ncbi:MAG: GAF domain-containing protein [Chloroflexota bacterium]|nr:GAF domain-containing protein [Chloroflexota bacterium]
MSVPGPRLPATTAALAAAADALRAAHSQDQATETAAHLALQLIPGALQRVLLYLLVEGTGGAALPATTLRLYATQPPPAGDPPAAPPLESLVAVAQTNQACTWAAGESAAGWLLLPLVSGPVNGTLALQWAAPLPPTVAVAYRLLAGLIAGTLELIVVRGQAGRGAAEISLLDQLSEVVNSSLSLDDILRQSLALLEGLIPFSGGSIALINEANELQIHTDYGVADAVARQVRMPVGQGISGWVAAHGQPYLSNDLDAEQTVRPAQRTAGTNRRIGAYMAAPLTVADRVIGILQINSTAKHVYSRRDLTLLAEVAERCAVAVERARLFTEMATRAKRLASLAEIARRISAALDLDELFAICYEQIAQTMAADAFFVALYDEEAATVQYEFIMDAGQSYAKRSEPFGAGVTSYVIRTRTPLIAGQLEQLPIAPIPFGIKTRTSESLLLVPLLFEGRMLGAMSTQSYRPHAYSDDDLNLLITIGNQAAVAIRNAQLYQSERTAQQAKDEFLSLVSHELRTPLTTIKGAAQVMQRRMVRAFSAGLVKTPEEQAAREQDLRQLAQVVTQADRLTALVNDLLDVSRLQSGHFEFHPEPADLAATVQGVVEVSRPLSSTHRLVLTAPPTLPGVFDRLRIEQVLTNLISNAVKYAPAGTEVCITLTTADPGVALLRVADQGSGLPAPEQEQLFQRFFRGSAVRSNPRTGVGLGLYISRQIVEWHGGTIGVDSTPGAGSVFHFTLPLTRPPAADE